MTGLRKLLSLVDEGWRTDAACIETDPDAWFPETGGNTREAKRVCKGCAVRDQCLAFALAHGERWGVWGGLSPAERRRLTGRASRKRDGDPADTVEYRRETVQRMTAAGRSPAEIAEFLHINERTVFRLRGAA